MRRQYGPSSGREQPELRLAFDLTDQVIEWVEYGAPNDGLLLKLAEGEEEYVVGGPRLPSSEFANPALRPMLEVSWMSP